MNIEDVAARIRRLEDAEGHVDEDKIIEDARDPRSPYHAYFWGMSEAEAAQEHRRSLARVLIRRIKIEVTVRNVPLTVVRYVRDPDRQGPDRGYRDILRVKSDDDRARAAIIDEMQRVSSAVKRARAVAAFLGVGDDLERIEQLAASIQQAADEGDPAEA